VQLHRGPLVARNDDEPVRERRLSFQRGDVDPRGAPDIVDDQDERFPAAAGCLYDPLEPLGGFGDDARRVWFIVTDEHQLVGAGERGPRGRVVEARAAVEHERPDEL